MAEWFAPKTYGYGAGLPIAPAGWALLGAYSAALLGLGAALLPEELALFLVGAAGITAALIAVAAKTTRGGFRWRWGDKD